jgi:hypothetical protein
MINKSPLLQSQEVSLLVNRMRPHTTCNVVWPGFECSPSSLPSVKAITVLPQGSMGPCGGCVRRQGGNPVT